MKKGILVLGMVLMVGFSFGQVTFQKVYTHSKIYEGKSVQQTTDGGYIIGGTMFLDSIKSYDFFIIKTNANGDTIWTKILGTAGAEELVNICQTTDGGYIMGGSGSGKILVIKTSSSGSITWAKTIGGFVGASAKCIKPTSDGGYIIGGYTNNFGNGIYLVKLSSIGSVSWGKTFYGSDFLQLSSLQQTTDGGFVISGPDYFTTGTNGWYILKVTNSGALSWAKSYVYLYPDFVPSYSIQTSDGGYMYVGSYSAGGIDDYLSLIKTDAAGSVTWAKGYDYTGGLHPSGLKQTTDGGYVINGLTSIAGDSSDVFLLKTLSNGNVSWAKSYGSYRNESSSSVQQTTDGGYIVSGTSTSFGGNPNSIYIIKTNTGGTSGCNEGSINVTSSTISPIVNSFTQTSSTGDTVSTPIISSTRGCFVANACLIGAINELPSENFQLNIYPNPATTNFTIAFASITKKVVLTITDITGKLLYTATATETEKMNVTTSSFAEGIYIVKIQTEEGVETRKLVVQK